MSTLITPDFVAKQVNPLNGGVQYLFEFENKRGASVIQHSFSYGNKEGLWELAVLDNQNLLDYSTPITGDVLGYLSDEEVNETLKQIAALD